MKFENSGIQNMTAELNHLDHLLPKYGLIRAEQWDYERVSYDRKFELRDGVYYLRLLGYATEGDVGAHQATIKFLHHFWGSIIIHMGLNMVKVNTFLCHS